MLIRDSRCVAMLLQQLLALKFCILGEARSPTICGCLGADVAARPETDHPVLPDPGAAFLPVPMSAKG
jgi:hypothetical protein